MEHIYIIQDVSLIAQLQNKTVVVETDDLNKIEDIQNAVQEHNQLFCIKLNVNQDITSIVFKDEWKNIPLVVYPTGLGLVRDFIKLLPLLKKLNVKFFLDGASAQNYEAVQILSSLGIYSGIVINENANWEKLTDMIYYALCNRVQHAPVEPFQYVYDTYKRQTLVDYGTVFFENPERFEYLAEGRRQKAIPITLFSKAPLVADWNKPWQRFFYEGTECAACEGWRICLGKYAAMKDKNGCRDFTVELLDVVENRKFKQ
ncbi:MAG: hypothetical protein FWH59_04255 [Lentimicrobiaceae bacterium]|nr:hypothetical protein [Lentimicrobiaceae bacterium]